MLPQMGPAASNVRFVAIDWGRQDKLCFPGQAIRAEIAFSGSRLEWFDACGHFPIWDQRSLTAKFILGCLDQERNSKSNEPQCGKEFEQRLWNIGDILHGAVQDTIAHQQMSAHLATKKAHEELAGLLDELQSNLKKPGSKGF
jgi:hypothetical protein